MPLIANFYGIMIKMYFNQENNKTPRIHAIYGEHIVVMDIRNVSVIDGELPIRAQEIVKEWIQIYKRELLDMWNEKEFKKIPPLK